MTINIEMGNDGAGRPVAMDVEELLATRLLVQGNSGSGKSHLLRRMLEGSGFRVLKVVTWGGLAAGTAPPWLKRPADRLAKRWGFGDVMLFQAVPAAAVPARPDRPRGG